MNENEITPPETKCEGAPAPAKPKKAWKPQKKKKGFQKPKHLITKAERNKIHQKAEEYLEPLTKNQIAKVKLIIKENKLQTRRDLLFWDSVDNIIKEMEQTEEEQKQKRKIVEVKYE